MITGTIQFIVEVDVECKDEKALNEVQQQTKQKLLDALPKALVEAGDDDIEESDDDDDDDEKEP